MAGDGQRVLSQGGFKDPLEGDQVVSHPDGESLPCTSPIVTQ